MKNLKVVDSHGNKDDFKPIKIKTAIVEETHVSEEKAEKIKNRIMRKLNSLKNNKGLTEISTSAIRAEVSSQLLKEGEFKAEEDSRKLGISVSEFENLVKSGDNSNANIDYSPEMIAKYAYDSIAKEYALLSMPDKCAEAHREGYVHHHDLEYFNTRANCMNYDLRFFGKNGLKIDGKGQMGAVAGPAKSLEVILNHLLQAWMAGATVFSGGQGYINFNTLLSPYVRGRSYKDVKQAIQGFIYNANMSLICRGGQVLFSSIGMDLSVPPVLADEPAIGPGGIAVSTYKDYTEEADMIFRAVAEVLGEKDAEGRPFRFPNTLYNIRKGDLDEYSGNAKILHELGAKIPAIYYVNCTSQEKTVMGCRTALPPTYTGDYFKDCANTGNFMYSTLNLPLIALDSDSEEDFYNKLDYYCEIVYDTLIFRRQEIEKVLYEYHMSDFLLQKDKETGVPLYDLDTTTITIGYCGLNECLMELYDMDLAEAEDKGLKIVEFINDKKQEFFERDGLRWSVIASPAESTAGRFAKINIEKYPNACVQGVKDGYYLTNSHHLPVDKKHDLIGHIKNADKFHPLSAGGCILHLWMGEAWSDPEALYKFNKKIVDTGTQFWAYTRDLSVCEDCMYQIYTAIDECPRCRSDNITMYSRITGYYLPVNTWNNSKKREFTERFRHSIDPSIYEENKNE